MHQPAKKKKKKVGIMGMGKYLLCVVLDQIY